MNTENSLSGNFLMRLGGFEPPTRGLEGRGTGVSCRLASGGMALLAGSHAAGVTGGGSRRQRNLTKNLTETEASPRSDCRTSTRAGSPPR
jgi:hypothetical protein